MVPCSRSCARAQLGCCRSDDQSVTRSATALPSLRVTATRRVSSPIASTSAWSGINVADTSPDGLPFIWRMEIVTFRRPPHAWPRGRAFLYAAQDDHHPLADRYPHRSGVRNSYDEIIGAEARMRVTQCRSPLDNRKKQKSALFRIIDRNSRAFTSPAGPVGQKWEFYPKLVMTGPRDPLPAQASGRWVLRKLVIRAIHFATS